MPLVWDAMEVGMGAVQDYFKEEKIDKTLAPNILRYRAKQYIKDNKWRLDGVNLENLAANGISIFYKNHNIRIFKYNGKDLPSPGRSRKKEAFLRQSHKQQITLSELFGEEELRDNLVLLWETDGEYQLKGLRLSHPQYDPTGEAEIKADWSILLEHPVTIKDRQSTEHKEVSEVYDLPLENLSKEGEAVNESDS